MAVELNPLRGQIRKLYLQYFPQDRIEHILEEVAKDLGQAAKNLAEVSKKQEETAARQLSTHSIGISYSRHGVVYAKYTARRSAFHRDRFRIH